MSNSARIPLIQGVESIQVYVGARTPHVQGVVCLSDDQHDIIEDAEFQVEADMFDTLVSKLKSLYPHAEVSIEDS